MLTQRSLGRPARIGWTVAALVTMSLSTGTTNAVAAPTPPPIIVTPGGAGGTVGIEVRSPGAPGGTRPGAGSAADPEIPLVDPCSTNPTGSACAASDHALYCWAWGTTFTEAGLPATGIGPLLQGVGCAPTMPVITPAMLAQRAYRLLRLPKPTIERSPDANNRDAGRPYTWVNLWTWFWTAPQTFTVQSKTVSAGAISATATARPVALVFDPGTGAASVNCPGPGRPWREADGDSAPSAGGCGFVYRHVSNGVSATVAIQWTVTWTGSNGTSGQLPPLVTSATSTFAVQQVQVVNR